MKNPQRGFSEPRFTTNSITCSYHYEHIREKQDKDWLRERHTGSRNTEESGSLSWNNNAAN